MSATIALFHDAYRELNSRKLFWITLILSVIIVAVFGLFGLNEQGVSFGLGKFSWTIDSEWFNSTIIPPKSFYLFAFANFAVPIWLSWVAMILALISTASIIPEFVSGGSIELLLSKPIGRVRLFLTKFSTALLFAGLQVAAFSIACFIIIALRGEAIEWRVFLAIPIVLLVFAYLYSFCALMGLLTRSTIASVLLTAVFWIALFGVNTTENVFQMLRIQREVKIERLEAAIDRQEKRAEEYLARERANGNDPVPAGQVPEVYRDEFEAVSPTLGPRRRDLEETRQSLATWQRWHRILFMAKSVLPKTAETTGLLDRYLISDKMRETLQKLGQNNRRGGDQSVPDEDDEIRIRGDDREVQIRLEEAVRGRTETWVIGTSLGFVGVMLGLSCLIFGRRDF